MNTKKLTRIYTVIISCILMYMGSMITYGFSLRNINYYSQHYSYTSKTSSCQKKDNSAAMAYYMSGPSTADTMYVQLWGSDGKSADAFNFTNYHYEGNLKVNYYPINKGCQKLIHNGSYEHYNGKHYVSLKVWVYGIGDVSGRWSETTLN